MISLSPFSFSSNHSRVICAPLSRLHFQACLSHPELELRGYRSSLICGAPFDGLRPTSLSLAYECSKWTKTLQGCRQAIETKGITARNHAKRDWEAELAQGFWLQRINYIVRQPLACHLMIVHTAQYQNTDQLNQRCWGRYCLTLGPGMSSYFIECIWPFYCGIPTAEFKLYSLFCRYK